MLASYKVWSGFLQHLPRPARNTLGEKIDSLFTEILDSLLRAGYSGKTKKLRLLDITSVHLDSLKFFLRVSWELQYINDKKYIRLSQELSTVGKMLGGWKKQLQTESPPQGGGF